ncbi:hypothetical protein Q3G72_030798 [Acer saccharum]|nr:hypothetical protein Q3G72_030798 [Acer saccharum]
MNKRVVQRVALFFSEGVLFSLAFLAWGSLFCVVLFGVGGCGFCFCVVVPFGWDGNGGVKDFRESLFSVFVGNINPTVDSAGFWGIFKPFRKGSAGFPEKTRKFRERATAVQLGKEKERSFVEIAKGFQDPTQEPSFEPAVQVKKKNLSMSWVNKDLNQEWLNICSIRVLKEFAAVSRVNNRLLRKGFGFSSSYIGDKCSLWTFESVVHREEFISCKGLWNDVFSSMVKWSDFIVPQARPVWFNIMGVPLSLWTSNFFYEAGTDGR